MSIVQIVGAIVSGIIALLCLRALVVGKLEDKREDARIAAEEAKAAAMEASLEGAENGPKAEHVEFIRRKKFGEWASFVQNLKSEFVNNAVDPNVIDLA